MDRSETEKSTGDHVEGSDARPKDTLERDEGQNGRTAPAPEGDGEPVVDDKGRPLGGDGLIKDDKPVVTPSNAERI
ncbi:hypothetical protein [Sphingomonas crocodyli]|uniref:Uncharacterized protein n=1 Tax=Sphingomonas crocodyli TaxID=1979270 RepID=A0A437LYT8_9SPHN|nr:hypothetical protein [Sphingomonas crocodyli]RVT90483.1 hypothetical protein EOD43_19730 [Sphingomonas crocodyli]